MKRSEYAFVNDQFGSFTDKVNELAKDGWRVVHMSTASTGSGYMKVATTVCMEREVNDE